jgi:hypothetical protein
MAGTVMNGPVPTMFDMLMETALRSPRLRGSRGCSDPDRAAGVLELAVKCEPILWISESEYCNSPLTTKEFSDLPKALRLTGTIMEHDPIAIGTACIRRSGPGMI